MNEDELKKFERHIGLGKEIKLKAPDGKEDGFYFKPLGVKFLPKFMRLAGAMELSKEDQGKLNDLNTNLKTRKIGKEQFELESLEINERAGKKLFEGENAEILVDLIDKMVKQSHPELKDKEEIRHQFIFNNLFDLFDVLMELNKSFTGIGEQRLSKIEQMRARVTRPK